VDPCLRQVGPPSGIQVSAGQGAED
jgi:hypothetical protein